MWSAPFCKKFSHPFSAFPTQRCPPHLESRTPSLPPAPSLVPWPQSHQQEEEAAGKRAELSGLIFKHSACRQQRRALGGFPAGRVSDGQARLQPPPPLPPPPPAGASSIPVSPPSLISIRTLAVRRRAALGSKPVRGGDPGHTLPVTAGKIRSGKRSWSKTALGGARFLPTPCSSPCCHQ